MSSPYVLDEEKKQTILKALSKGEVTVGFRKKDGTDRIMVCTRSSELIPQSNEVVIGEARPEHKENPDVCAVYDTEVNGWRSFRWDSVVLVLIHNKEAVV
jgi:hypothetical protein